MEPERGLTVDEARFESGPDIAVCDSSALASMAATRMAREIALALERRGRCAVALSGGSTPASMFEHLASDHDLDWRAVDVFQVDEREAPDGDPDRNLTGLRETLLLRVPIPYGNVHPMPVGALDRPEEALNAYERELAEVCPGGLDIVHLGLGDDGHTASWPPDVPRHSYDVEGDVAVVGPYRGRRRMTLTPQAIRRAGRVLWLVSGIGKAQALNRLLAHDEMLPATLALDDRSVVLCDRQAASALTSVAPTPRGDQSR